MSKLLESEQRRFLVIIDDIDRLSPDEALAVFRLLKSVGHLPNVLYLVVFDHELADQAVLQRFPSEGPHYLEKIIQAAFELPTPLQTDLNNAVTAAINEVCTTPEGADTTRIMNIFFDVIVPYMTTPRHVTRFKSAISVTWPAVANEVNLADFLALETLRLYEPELFKASRAHKKDICGTRGNGDDNRRDDGRFKKFIANVPEVRHEVAKITLQRIFPRLETMGYGGEWVEQWDAERRICVDKHFDTYFRLSLSEEALSVSEIDELIAKAALRDFIQERFRAAAKIERRNHQSRVPILLDALTMNALRVAPSNVGPLLSSLFEIHDEIDLERDRDQGFYGIANTTLRYHWLIRRLTRDRFTLDGRTSLYLAALKEASLGWLVEFAASAKRDYSADRRQAEEKCLVTEDAVPPLVEMALIAIRQASASGALLASSALLSILYHWKDFSHDPMEVCCWTSSLMKNDAALVTLARAMTGQSRSMGMGGFGILGDRVSRSTNVAQINDSGDIIDAKAFRVELERIRDEAKLDTESLSAVATFLEAWDRPTHGSF